MPLVKIFRHIFKGREFKESLKLAVKGILYLFLYHRNMRVIFLMGIAASLLGLYLRLRGIELAILFTTVTIVFVSEIFNTAIEILMDIVSEEHHVKIKLVKDISAAVVLLASLNAMVIGYIIFVHRFSR